MPAVTARLLNAVRSGSSDQFEIDSDDRNLRLSATAFTGPGLVDDLGRHGAEET
jgi:hypothetical protein